jgi:hypothetical protein
MSNFHQLLKNVYVNVYDLTNLKQFSIPKIYDAKGDLNKRWYVYFSFRNPVDNKLKMQNPIFSEINRFKTIKERKAAAKILCSAVKTILDYFKIQTVLDTTLYEDTNFQM